jgi:DNA-binding transcriptional LysR family regulator
MTIIDRRQFMDKLASLRAFTKVVESASFSEAGKKLRLSRSAISKHVGDLEQELGVQLLSRTTRRVTPTEQGQTYFERAIGILADLEAADRAVAERQSSPRGLLRINAPMSFGTLKLGPAIAEFMERFSDLQIQLALSDEQVDPLQEGLDIVLRIAELESSSLIARKLLPIPRSLCASPDYLRAHGEPKHPDELRDHACLAYGYLLTGNQWKLTGPDGDHWINPRWPLCANNAEVLCDAAVRGRGIALLPHFIAEDAIKRGALRPILVSYTAPQIALYAVYPPTRHLAVKVRAFIDFLVERFERE